MNNWNFQSEQCDVATVQKARTGYQKAHRVRRIEAHYKENIGI